MTRRGQCPHQRHLSRVALHRRQLPSYDDLIETRTGYTDLGVEVAPTELDVRFENAATANKNTWGLAMQAQTYYDSAKACVDVEDGVVITGRGFVDTCNWVPDTFEGQGAADMCWEDHGRKPAYYAMAERLQGIPCTYCG